MASHLTQKMILRKKRCCTPMNTTVTLPHVLGVRAYCCEALLMFATFFWLFFV